MLTSDDIHYLYRLANTYYTRGLFGDLSRQDFKQMCALEAVEKSNTIDTYDTIKDYVACIVHNTARNNYLSKSNLKDSRAKKWRAIKAEKVAIDDAPEIEDTHSVETIEAGLHHSDVKKTLRNIKNILTPLEYQILILTYYDRKQVEIQQQLSISKKTLYNYRQSIKSKLGNIEL